MALSTTFTIDPESPWIQAHNTEVRSVLGAWKNDRPIRVPLVCDDTAIQHGLYADETHVDYAEYYTNPDEMVRVQLEAARFRREQPIYDFELGVLPDSWPIVVDFWPVPAPGWLGCGVTFRSNGSPVHTPLNLTGREALSMEMPNPRDGGMLSKVIEFVEYIDHRWTGKEFLGKPIGPIYSGVDHNGVFAMALDIRGQGLFTDFYEDPEFVGKFLRKIGDWCDAFDSAWPSAFPHKQSSFRNSDHGIDMLSAAMYEEFILPVIVEINRRRSTPLPSSWHYCGGGMHLVNFFARHYPIKWLDDVAYPLLNLAEVRRIMGDEVWVKAVVEDGIVHAGPTERITHTIRNLIESGAAGTGRFCISVGDMLPGTPVEHRAALYSAVREHGEYHGRKNGND